MTEPLAPTSGPPEGPRAPDRGAARARSVPRWGIPDAALGFFFGLLGATIGVGLDGGAEDPDRLSLPIVVGGLLGLWAGYVGTCVVVARLKGHGSLADDFGLRVGGGRELALGVAAGLLASRVLVWLVYEALLALRVLDQDDVDRLSEPAERLTDLIQGPGAVVLFLFIGIGAPVVEELFYRGLLQRSLVRRLGPVLGIPVGALVFAAAHRQGLQFPALLAFGLVLGWLAHRTGRLAAPIAAHVVFNCLTLLSLLLSS